MEPTRIDTPASSIGSYCFVRTNAAVGIFAVSHRQFLSRGLTISVETRLVHGTGSVHWLVID